MYVCDCVCLYSFTRAFEDCSLALCSFHKNVGCFPCVREYFLQQEHVQVKARLACTQQQGAVFRVFCRLMAKSYLRSCVCRMRIVENAFLARRAHTGT
jgi:hypothetical protein